MRGSEAGVAPMRENQCLNFTCRAIHDTSISTKNMAVNGPHCFIINNVEKGIVASERNNAENPQRNRCYGGVD
jgi:hypothetical protein